MDEPVAPSRRVRIAVDALALLIVLALAFAKLASMQHSVWRSFLLSNGDSLTLPLLLQSLQRGEPFQWIFSSQTFFFPEFPLYAICGLIMGSPQGGLVLNAVVNVVLLYAGFRAIAAAYAPRQWLRQLLVALGAIVLFLVAILTESDVAIIGVGTVEPARIGTVFLLTTYYGGVILVGVGTLALLFWVGGDLVEPPRNRRVVVAGVAIVIVGTLTMYSDPLYLLWIVIPFCSGLVVLLLVRRTTVRWALILGFPLILAAGLGNTLRLVIPQFITAGYATYLTPFGEAESVRMLGGVIADWLSTPQGILRLIVVLGPIIFVFVMLVRRFGRTSISPGRAAGNAELLLMLFIAVSFLSLIVGVIVTGQSVTRYLVPLYVFPPLGLLLVRRQWFSRAASRLRPLGIRVHARTVLALVLAAASLATIGVAAPSVAALGDKKPPVDVACLDDWLAGRPLNGAGDFWTVRALTLYGSQTGAIVQIDFPLSVHPWMNNLALYTDRTFSFVIADQVAGRRDIVTALGEPARVVTCSGYQIYDYVGTHAAVVLTKKIRTSYQDFVAIHPRS